MNRPKYLLFFIPVLSLCLFSCVERGKKAGVTEEVPKVFTKPANSPIVPGMSLIAIRGDHKKEMDKLLLLMGYKDAGKRTYYGSLETMSGYLQDHYIDTVNQNKAIRGLYADGNWTLIWDPEMVDALNEDKLATLSYELKSDVLIFLVEQSTGSYGFALFNPEKKRGFYSIDGKVTENFGAPLADEEGVSLDTMATSIDIAQLADRLKVNIGNAQSDSVFQIRELIQKLKPALTASMED